MPIPPQEWTKVKRKTDFNRFTDFVMHHRGKFTVIGMIAFSTFVHSLPMSIHSSNGFVVWFYDWFYSFLHALSGGLSHPIGGDAPW